MRANRFQVVQEAHHHNISPGRFISVLVGQDETHNMHLSCLGLIGLGAGWGPPVRVTGDMLSRQEKAKPDVLRQLSE